MTAGRLAFVGNLVIVLVGIVFILSMADVDLIAMTERDLVIVLGGIVALIWWAILYFVSRGRKDV